MELFNEDGTPARYEGAYPAGYVEESTLALAGHEWVDGTERLKVLRDAGSPLLYTALGRAFILGIP